MVTLLSMTHPLNFETSEHCMMWYSVLRNQIAGYAGVMGKHISIMFRLREPDKTHATSLPLWAVARYCAAAKAENGLPMYQFGKRLRLCTIV